MLLRIFVFFICLFNFHSFVVCQEAAVQEPQKVEQQGHAAGQNTGGSQEKQEDIVRGEPENVMYEHSKLGSDANSQQAAGQQESYPDPSYPSDQPPASQHHQPAPANDPAHQQQGQDSSYQTGGQKAREGSDSHQQTEQSSASTSAPKVGDPPDHVLLSPNVVASIIQEVELEDEVGERHDAAEGDDYEFDEEDEDDSEEDSGEDDGSQYASKPTRQKTAQELRADEIYEEADSIINQTKTLGPSATSMLRKAYKLLEESAALGSIAAGELVGFAYLFGDNLPWNPRRAREIFEDLTVKGSPRGQAGLAFVYTAGITVNSSQSKALVYLTFGSLGGDPWAQMALGYRYWSGINLGQSCESALTYYRKVAENVASDVSVSGGTAIARIRLADEESGGSQQNSPLMDNDLLQYYKFLADKGDIQAQIGLGQLYLNGGRGLEQNLDRAYQYFASAAEAGNSNAYAYLGKIYLEGTSTVKADNRTALEYFKRAADKGNPVGQSGLGLMYLYGKGVDQDYAKAIKFFQAAADQGWVDGQLQLGTMYFSGLGVRRDYKLATKYFQLASQSGHVLAFYNLAQMHATGTGMMRNCHTATELYKNVAERGKWSDQMMQAHSAYREGRFDQAALKYLFLAELGYEVAQSNIAYLLDQGHVSMFDKFEMYPRALIHWERAAEQGSGYARLRLGDYHYYGQGTTVDYSAAAHHYKIASEQQHNAQAMFNLAYMHEQGLGIKRDIHLAKRFYDLAAETSTEAQLPVSLALAKLSFLFAFHHLQTKDWWKLEDVDKMLGSDWDIYVIGILLVFLVTFIYLRNLRMMG